jgi:hypothetical protein
MSWWLPYVLVGAGGFIGRIRGGHLLWPVEKLASFVTTLAIGDV